MKKGILGKCLILASVVLLTHLATFEPVTAAESKAKFPSTTITFIVPVTPGGGFDTFARILAPYLKKYLPGQPNVVVKNVPGGDWRIGIMETVKAKPDGHTICMFNLPGNAMGQITGAVPYDLGKVAWIGRITDTIYVTALSPKAAFRSFEDFRKASQVKVGVTGLTSSTTLGTVITAQEIGYKVKLINHDGSPEAMLSAIRGDVDMVTLIFSTLKKFVVDSKELVPLTVYTPQRLKDLPDTPTIGELGYDKLKDVVSIDYMVGATPGIPDDVMKVWSEAFDKAVADPEYRKMMTDQIKHSPSSLNGIQTARRVNDYLTTYTKYKDLIAQHTAR